ncbi:MAG TPA: sugar ABC transporter ATP-binding protein [Blastocatellia bacterium]|nr:sugar ABC transporter ATP-binding protein [Blastocatellia bacterium]
MATEPSFTHILEMFDIRKAFPGVVALDGVSFELHRGEVHVLLGENGAGKSTLMKILSGAYQKTTGRILLDGAGIEIRSPRHAQELGISTIYQEFNLVPQLSAAENIFLGREPSLLPGVIDRKSAYQSARLILRELGATFDARSPVRKLGMAQQQIVEVAKAISLNSRILIMDEPTSALTQREIQELFARIRSLKQSGVSVVYISHRLEEIFEIGDRVTVLRDGRNVGTLPIADVTKHDLIRMMVDRELTQLFPKTQAQIGEEVFRADGLNKREVLKDISFSLHRGEVLGIAGLLGSGRTELARVIFGVDKPDSGALFIKGKLQKVSSPRSAVKLGIGFLTEDRKTQGLVLGLPVKENICLPSLDRFSRLGVVRRRDEDAAAQTYVKQLRIKTAGIDQKVVFLSGGNQQKVVLSKWLCSQVDIFIFDEPTRGIDVGSKTEIYQLINGLTAAGVAIIMISSELPEVLGMSDRILVMHGGEIKGEFPASEATQEKLLHCALSTDGSSTESGSDRV